MECLSYCLGNSIDLAQLDAHFKINLQGYAVYRARDVLKLHSNAGDYSTIFVFKNGAVVSWGVKRYKTSNFLKMIKLFVDKPIHFRVRDQLSYRLGDKTTIESHNYFDVDCLTIEAHNDEIKLSLSYGLAQSVKLQYFEIIIDALIEKYGPIIQNLSNTGKMSISRNKIRQIVGEILGAKSEMNLVSNFLYHPKYFWQHPTSEVYYTMLERYLHIQRRVNTINHRLDTLNEIFAMFNVYLENKHAHNLEIIIIVIITLETLIAVLNFHF